MSRIISREVTAGGDVVNSFLRNSTNTYVFVEVRTMFFAPLLMAFTVLQTLSIEIA